MKLHTKILGQGQPLIILHGLFGSSDNWFSIGRTLSERFKVLLVDARNHGHSPHSDEFNYTVMAGDIHEIVEDNSLENCILIGHSMGGKTAMKFAQKFPEYVSRLIVVDISHKTYPVKHHAVLKALRSVDFAVVKSRKETEKKLSEHIHDESVIQFLLKNLYWTEKNQLDWRFNLGVISANIESVGEDVKGRVFDKATLFIRGENSDYIEDADWPELKNSFPKASLVTIPGAVHWVHAQQPESFLKTILAFISE